MGIPLRTLIIEDSEDDALMVVRTLEKGGYDPAYERVETRDAMGEALERGPWDIIISDYKMPHFSGLAALELYKEEGLDIPFILVSGTIGEEVAVEAMKTGAHDYVMKNNLSRLVSAIQRELREAESRREGKRTDEALKLSEQKYRSIFENSIEGIFQTTPDGRYLSANPAFARMYGYDSPTDLMESTKDLNQQQYVNPGDRDRLKVLYEKDGFVEGLEIQICQRNGEQAWISMNGRAVRDQRGEIVRYEGMIQDITAVKAKSDELKIMSRQLWQTAKLATVGELAASIAHELNNPLATVSLRVESLASQMPEGDPGAHELAIIGHEVDRMATLVANLLQFSRLSQRQVSTLAICEEIEKTLELVEYHLRNHRIELVREFAPEIPKIYADRQQVRQLFLNLFINAGDAMSQGGTLRIGIYVQNGGVEKPDSLIVEIGDTGTGIAPDILPKVMDPFFTTKGEDKGTGLGLAICNRIINDHGGILQIRSSIEPHQCGTTVSVTFPLPSPDSTTVKGGNDE